MGGRMRRALAAAIAVGAALPACAFAHEQAAAGNPLLEAFTRPLAGQAVNNDRPAELGRFGAPFTEPMIGARRTDAKCIENGADGSPLSDARHLDCKPGGVSINVLPGKKVIYYDGLEGTENIRTSIVAEFGHNAGNDPSRLMNLAGPSWSIPHPP